MTSSREAISQLFRVTRDHTADQQPLPAIYPNQLAPVVRAGPDGTREMLMMRWGFPPPPTLGSRPVTNVRNTASGFWRPWLAPPFRCLVPVTEFCEYSDSLPKTPHWFALSPHRPAFAFVGIWRPGQAPRKGTKGEHPLFAFLTTEPNEGMRPIHAKAMPVILTGDDCDRWLESALPAALDLQKPGPPEQLQIVTPATRQERMLF